MAEDVGFEPTDGEDPAADFQDRSLKPLSQSSKKIMRRSPDGGLRMVPLVQGNHRSTRTYLRLTNRMIQRMRQDRNGARSRSRTCDAQLFRLPLYH